MSNRPTIVIGTQTKFTVEDVTTEIERAKLRKAHAVSWGVTGSSVLIVGQNDKEVEVVGTTLGASSLFLQPVMPEGVEPIYPSIEIKVVGEESVPARAFGDTPRLATGTALEEELANVNRLREGAEGEVERLRKELEKVTGERDEARDERDLAVESARAAEEALEKAKPSDFGAAPPEAPAETVETPEAPAADPNPADDARTLRNSQPGPEDDDEVAAAARRLRDRVGLEEAPEGGGNS